MFFILIISFVFVSCSTEEGSTGQVFARVGEKKLTKEDIKEMSRVIKKFVFDTTTAVDIGCHYGFFTRFLSEQFKTVHAFDFNNDIFECFKENMKKFKCENVIAYPHGLGEKQKYVATKDWSEKHNRRGPLSNHIDPDGEIKNQKIKKLDSFKFKKLDIKKS